jgi:hypothetical protein
MFLRLFTLAVTALLAAGCYECTQENCKDGPSTSSLELDRCSRFERGAARFR